MRIWTAVCERNQRKSKAKHIDSNVDSPYSYFALTWLLKNKQLLADHGVAVDLHPVFLGGINVGSGNKPPWTLAAKAKYGKYDGPRAQKYFGTGELKAPSFFPILSILPLRCMLYIKSHFPVPQYEAQFRELWIAYWNDSLDISNPEIMAQCLSHHFKDDEVKAILEGAKSAEFKKMLTDETARLVEKRAFGAPWFLVKNRQGEEEPFFGSDRFHYMLQYLEVPFTDIEIQPAKGAKL